MSACFTSPMHFQEIALSKDRRDKMVIYWYRRSCPSIIAYKNIKATIKRTTTWVCHHYMRRSGKKRYYCIVGAYPCGRPDTPLHSTLFHIGSERHGSNT